MQTKPGLWRRVPPAIFPPILGLMGLGLAWRRAPDVFAIPAAPGEVLLGMTTLLFLFAAIAYLAKIARRPAVLAEELRILPGRAGVTAATMSLMLFALVLEPFAPGPARLVLIGGLAAHTLVAALIIRVLVAGPPEQRRVTPVWHLSFVGFIVGALAAVPLELPELAWFIFWATLPVAAGIWTHGIGQFLRADTPAPLRPVLAMHLAPFAILGAVALLIGQGFLASILAGCGLALLLMLAVAIRWLTEAGFSPFWGAFTFPLSGYAGLTLLMAGYAGGPWRIIAGLVLVAATLAVPPIVWKVMQMWAKGTLAVKTNAAAA